MAKVRVLVVDDLASWRRCVSMMLEECSKFEIVGEASDGLEAVQRTAELQPDLILLDVGLPRLNGIKAARQICAVAPRSTILFVSENRSPAIIEEVLHSSTCTFGYLFKSEAADYLQVAMETVMQRKQFVNGKLLP